MSKLSKEQSLVFAAQFELLKRAIHMLDWDYAATVIKAFREQANFQDTAIVFNPDYPLKKNDLMRLQAEALEKFAQGVALLRRCDELKKEVYAEASSRAKIGELFI